MADKQSVETAAAVNPLLERTSMAKKKSAKKSGGKKKASRKKTVAGQVSDMMESAGKGIRSAARATGKALGVTGTRRKRSGPKKKK